MEETSDRYKIEAPAVLLVGKTGSGKSTLGNSLLGYSLPGGEDVFEASNDPNSVTKYAKAAKLTIDGRPYNLVDTPGVFDTVTPGPQTLAEIARVIGECSYGIQAIIFVLEAGRFTKEQEAVIVEIKEFLGDESVSHMILAFSKCNKKQTIGNDLKFNEKLQQLVRETGDRWVISPNPEIFDPDSNTFMQQTDRLKYLIAGMKMPYTIALFNRIRIARETELARQREEREREEQRIEQARTQQLREEAEVAVRKQLEEENAHSKEELRRVEMEYAARMEEIQNRMRQADLEHATAMTALNERLDQAVRSAADLQRQLSQRPNKGGCVIL